MKQLYPLKIDAYSHIVPPKYANTLKELVPKEYEYKIAPAPALYDLDFRFRILDKYEHIVQACSDFCIPLF